MQHRIIMTDTIDLHSLKYDTYYSKQDTTYFDSFKISIFIEALKPLWKQEFPHTNHPHNNLVGKNLILKSKKHNTYYGESNGQTFPIDPKYFVLKFSNPNNPEINIDNLTQEIRTKDITTEFQQVANTLVFGYLHLHINYEKPIYDALRIWSKDNSESLLYLNQQIKNNTQYFFPDVTTMPTAKDSFQNIFEDAFANQPEKYKALLNEYLSDWEQILEPKKTKKHSI